MSDSLDRLFAAVQEARDRSPSVSRTSKLFRDGVQKMAKKLAEEAIEVGLDAVQMNRESVILESADVLYHLAVIWAECGISPADVMGELDRREVPTDPSSSQSPVPARPSYSKPDQADPNKNAWFYLVLFVRIGTYQWVTAN
ncbi:MAG TPA: phosphoribosyl-ATP diphosphatase, partial [Roseiarcus sp.]|nr:phosphoribosyl-ATP diphosphatase [Roseiarcus sp.]